jgi:protein-tyrosine phosphatase
VEAALAEQVAAKLWRLGRVVRHESDLIANAQDPDELRHAHERAAVERVELACGGGVGRTGTALAVLAVLSGVAATEAVAWVRAAYHPRAVETPWQRRWLRSVSRT